jgi:S1-C subfamily serine protease
MADFPCCSRSHSRIPTSLRLALGLSVIVTITVNRPLHAEPGVEASVVKLNVTKREPDYFRPWTKASPTKVSGSGVVIDGSRILTNAHVVMFASEVLVQLRQGGDQLAAKVTAIAPGIDLALVELKDPAGLKDVKPIPLADDLPEPKSTVSVYGYPEGGDDLSVTKGIVSRIEYTRSSFD